ncbi:hypothetical protein NKH77_40555 [Streptomyces sp. M19]
MTTSHVQYLTVTAQGVRVGDVLISTHTYRPASYASSLRGTAGGC